MTLPNFIVGGAPKAGTQSLFEYLRQNTDVFIPNIKEVRFFCYDGSENRYKYPVRTIDEYEDLFRSSDGYKAVGEVTSFYFWHEDSARRIRATIPDVKLIFCLREPVHRQFSIYHMNMRSRGRNEGLNFIEALKRDPHLQIKYYDCLDRYFNLFPKEQIKIILFDELCNDTNATMNTLYRFIGAQDHRIVEQKIHNPGGIPKSKSFHRLINNDRFRRFSRSYLPAPIVSKLKDLRSRNLEKDAMSMTEEEREFGERFFRDDVLRTQELIGVDLSRWLVQA